MITLIILGAMVLLMVLGWKYLTGKGKRQSERSGGESIANTIAKKMKRDMRSAAKGMRSAEVVRDELLDALEQRKVSAGNEVTRYQESLIRAKRAHKSIVASSKSNVEKYTATVKELKTKYTDTGDEKHKKYAEKWIAQIVALKSQIATSQSIVDSCESNIEDANMSYQLLLGSIETKRAEVLAIGCDPGNLFMFDNIDISDLTVEFKDKVEEKEIQAEVQRSVHGDVLGEMPTASKEDVDSLWNSL